MPNHPKAWPLLELSDRLAASLVAFSGRRSASEASAGHEVVFETTFQMLRSGFEPSYGLTAIAGLTAPDETSLDEMKEDELFDPAFRDATAVLCLYMHSLARSAMTPAVADQFDNALQSSVARLCAGQFGFDAEPPKVFETIQRLINMFLSETWLNERSVGKDDCIGKVLRHLSVSPIARTEYAFVVGSEKQPAGCGASFIRALGRTRELFSS